MNNRRATYDDVVVAISAGNLLTALTSASILVRIAGVFPWFLKANWTSTISPVSGMAFGRCKRLTSVARNVGTLDSRDVLGCEAKITNLDNYGDANETRKSCQ